MDFKKFKNTMSKVLTGNSDELLELSPPRVAPRVAPKAKKKPVAKEAPQARKKSSVPKSSVKTNKKPQVKVRPQPRKKIPVAKAEPRIEKNNLSKSSISIEKILKCQDLPTLLSLLSDSDRHKRHAALVQVGSLHNPDTIPDLLSCIDDESSEVRAAAKKYLDAMTTTENAHIFVLMLPEIYECRKNQRPSAIKYIDSVEEYLIRPENVLTIHNGINDPDKQVSHACFTLVVKYNLAEPAKFVMSTLKHPEKGIRIKAAILINHLKGEQKEEALNLALQDSYMPIRRDAFLESLKGWGKESLTKKMLFDPHFAIREIAIAHLKKSGEDVEHTYLSSLSDNNPIVICSALWGLGYLKVAECAKVVKPYLDDPHPKIREQAQATLEALKTAPKKFNDTVEWNSTDTHY